MTFIEQIAHEIAGCRDPLSRFEEGALFLLFQRLLMVLPRERVLETIREFQHKVANAAPGRDSATPDSGSPGHHPGDDVQAS